MRTSFNQRQRAMNIVRKHDGRITAAELSTELDCSGTWARNIINDLKDSGVLKLVDKNSNGLVYEMHSVPSVDNMPVLSFSSGPVNPMALVYHREQGGRTVQTIAGALTINQMIMEEVIDFFMARRGEAQSLKMGNEINDMATVRDKDRIKRIDQLLVNLHETIVANINDPVWFDAESLQAMPDSKLWNPNA